MIARLVARKLKPQGVPITLEIKPRAFEGENASEILEQVKYYFAEEVIPRVPFLRLDEPYREKVRRMSTVELTRTLVDYVNNREDASETYPMPNDEEQALVVMGEMGFLVIEK